MAAPQPDLAFLALQRELTFNLATFRAQGRSPLQDERPLADLLQLPKRGIFRSLKKYTQRRPRAWAYDELANPLGVGNRTHATRAKRRRIWLQPRLFPHGLVLVHTLGWGGNGLAALFRHPGQNGGPTQYLVAKIVLRPSQAAQTVLRHESSLHHRYRGALHIVQKKQFPPRLPPGPPPNDVLLLEHLRHGDLHKVLSPPGPLARWNHTSGRPGGGSGMVHWDIDPQNIMVGGNDGPPGDDHTPFPILKLGDLGLAVQMTPGVMNSKWTIWEARTRSKSEYLTPEQFTEEWDWVEEDPRDCDPPAKTAGKYSHLTNLYQFALVMANAITATYTQCPPIHSQMDIIDRNNPGQSLRVWTYGGYLLERRYRHVDILLRRLVAQCLCDQPAHRPNLDDLKRTIETRLAHHNWAGADAAVAVQGWTANVLGHPPGPPMQPVPPYWVDTPQRTPLPP
ncbi:hypothetical protein C8A05DRAFT_38517 [Staphylotrichum tortipilum]|uniref:Protein kinase domain-containing protein n=1 Tax=Staphylotrichum tortipilum TaxID=2831512 RepID=A0AAN6MBU5_9PEZI|nr:hypothetical protein C8A05DRAFT_38517 [Staphylotrichum longicolle]